MQNGLLFSILIVDDDPADRYLIDAAFLEIDFAQELKKFINGKGLVQYVEKIEVELLPGLLFWIILFRNLMQQISCMH